MPRQLCHTMHANMIIYAQYEHISNVESMESMEYQKMKID